MTQIVRFVDGVSYTEADQSDWALSILRPQGILPESSLGTLAPSAIGSMNVRIGPGEAHIQGFQYKSDANVDLTIGANSSGSTRIDRVVLSLNRATNTLVLAVVTGTPGAGAPALVQVPGGNWQFLIADITVVNAAASITSGNISDQRVYSRWSTSALSTPMTTADDIIVGGAGGTPTRMAKGSASRVFGVNAAGVLGYYPVTSDMLTDGTIVGADIAPGVITTSHIADRTIVAADIGVGQITTTEIQDRGIVAGDIAVGNITTTEIQDRGIQGTDIAVGTITSTEIQDGGIVNGDLAAQTIRGGVDGGASRIAVGSINSQDIQDGGIAGTDIGNGQIGYNQLAAGATSTIQGQSSAAAFAVSGINVWAHDNANLTITVTLPVAGFVYVTFQGSFYVTGAAGAAAFGISRLGFHASPPFYVVTSWDFVNTMRSVFVMLAETLPAGSYAYTLGMTASSPGVTVNAHTSPRYLVGMGFHR